MSVIFEGVDMPKACCFIDREHSVFAHVEYCKFYNVCKQRDTIKNNYKPDDCPVKPLEQEINWDEIDKQEISKSVVLLDMFTKTYCRYQNDYERFDDLKFRCDECPFDENGDCLVKLFKNKYAPDYRDFGSMGDL